MLSAAALTAPMHRTHSKEVINVPTTLFLLGLLTQRQQVRVVRGVEVVVGRHHPSTATGTAVGLDKRTSQHIVLHRDAPLAFPFRSGY